MKRFSLILIFILLTILLSSCGSSAKKDEIVYKEINIDYANKTGVIKDIFGGNKGGENIAAAPYLHEIGIKDIRIHDYHEEAGDYYFYSDFWNKNPDGSVSDINVDFNPSNPRHYHWENSDNVITNIINNDLSVYFRLGTSYPNSQYILQPQNPPANILGANDFSKFAGLCEATVNHYNKGWDNGFNYNIKYWEIWNEPGGLFWENGTPIEFFKMYEQVSTAIKSSNPNVKVGAPGAVYTTTLGIQTQYREGFISYCKKEDLDLDFYSWHVYGLSNPYGLQKISLEIRNILDENGFTEAQSHITEINDALGDGLEPLINSANGAAYYLSLMLTAQESEIDKFLLYPANCLITENLYADDFMLTKSAYAMKAFATMSNDAPVKIESIGNEVLEDKDDASLNFMVLATKNLDNNKVYILVSNFASENKNYKINISNLPWIDTSKTSVTQNIITQTEDFKESKFTLAVNTDTITVENMQSPSVLMLKLTPSN